MERVCKRKGAGGREEDLERLPALGVVGRRAVNHLEEYRIRRTRRHLDSSVKYAEVHEVAREWLKQSG
jgi:hypothetical protein